MIRVQRADGEPAPDGAAGGQEAVHGGQDTLHLQAAVSQSGRGSQAAPPALPDCSLSPARQDTDLRYLTGCLQSDTLLALEFSDQTSKAVLFTRPGTAYDERWEGERLGFGEAMELLGVDEAAPLSSLEQYLVTQYKGGVDVAAKDGKELLSC